MTGFSLHLIEAFKHVIELAVNFDRLSSSYYT